MSAGGQILEHEPMTGRVHQRMCHRNERQAAAMDYGSFARFSVRRNRRLAEARERLVPGARAYLQDAP